MSFLGNALSTMVRSLTEIEVGWGNAKKDGIVVGTGPWYDDGVGAKFTAGALLGTVGAVPGT